MCPPESLSHDWSAASRRLSRKLRVMTHSRSEGINRVLPTSTHFPLLAWQDPFSTFAFVIIHIFQMAPTWDSCSLIVSASPQLRREWAGMTPCVSLSSDKMTSILRDQERNQGRKWVGGRGWEEEGRGLRMGCDSGGGKPTCCSSH